MENITNSNLHLASLGDPADVNWTRRSCRLQRVRFREILDRLTRTHCLCCLSDFQDKLTRREAFAPNNDPQPPTTKMLTACMKPNSSSGEDLSQDRPYRKLRTPKPKQEGSQETWSDRYLAYKLVSRYTDLNDSAEQRELAKMQSQQLQDRFKLDLAMYAAHAQLSPKNRQLYANPTLFGDDVLRLIKLVVVGRSRLNYRRLTHLFMDKVEAIGYQQFKGHLFNYLGFGDRTGDWTDLLRQRLSQQLTNLYPTQNETIVDDALRFRTCKRAIELLTTEDGHKPSAMFTAKIACGMPFCLTIALLKLVLISPKSRSHLNLCISKLIRYYEQFPASECQSVIQFLEMFQIVFAIYADGVEYSLVKIKSSTSEQTREDRVLDLDHYRVFARLKSEKSGS